MAFSYDKNGALLIDGIEAASLAQDYGTPLYVYSADGLTDYFNAFQKAVSPVNGKVHFAVKANSNLAILSLLAEQGAGADIVSGGELLRALSAGISAKNIVFSGVGKTDDEIRLALSRNIGQINAESIAEIHRIEAIAKEWGLRAPVAIRVNPDIDAKSHEKISTGQKSTKFGIALDTGEAEEIYAYIHHSDHLIARGLAVHIGSQLTDLAPFKKAYETLIEVADSYRAKGFDVPSLDLGGGLGVDYHNDGRPDFESYGALVTSLFSGTDYELGFEPGRSIAADNGLLLSSVLYTKPGGDKDFIIIDAAMNDLIRPTLYEAHHRIEPVQQSNRPSRISDIVGPVCETGDYLAKGRDFPQMESGELIAVFNAGAYGSVMASNYNTRAHPAEILIHQDKVHVIKPRKAIEQLLEDEYNPFQN
ncbi:MAG: diaminopimelate decarboxylase [Candidatus Puniceispirillaceae bacterium]